VQVTTDAIAAVGSVAQAVVAVLAVYLAYRANAVARGAHVVERVVQKLFDVHAHASQVREAYHSLFGVFSSGQDKINARISWVEEREEVAVQLGRLAALFPALHDVRDQWRALEQEEDSHILTDSPAACPDTAARNAKRRYDDLHDAFCATLVTTLRTSGPALLKDRDWLGRRHRTKSG
jgi:hypothetical protein